MSTLGEVLLDIPLTFLSDRFLGVFFKSARIGSSSPTLLLYPHHSYTNFCVLGERLSPYVALGCAAVAVRLLIED